MSATRTDQPAADAAFVPRTDPVTFEVLRHRLWQVNEEQGDTILNVSGSPVAYDVNDFNVVIADPSGEVVCLGPYMTVHGATLQLVIRNAVEMFRDEPLRPGTMLLVNDPWLGAAHQNDVCLIAPVHHGDRVIGWIGSTIHEVDVGGTAVGSWNPVARDTFDEAPRWRYLQLVRDGRVQPEVLATYLANSRFPVLLELDVRAQIAAINVAAQRMADVIERFGVEAVELTMADMLDYSEQLLASKLRQVPDGSWSTEAFIDHDGHDDRVYVCRLELRKCGVQLEWDFTGTDAQSPGFINCAYGGLHSGVLTAILTHLCGDIPWNSGVMRSSRIVSAEGTIHNALFPAPVGSGVVNASWLTINACSQGLSKMLLASDALCDLAMGVWAGSTFAYNIHGVVDGREVGTMLLSSPLQGDGARAFADGYDVGGQLGAPRPSASNVESMEAQFPLIFIYRRDTVDSGGPGRWRGGVSAESAIAPYGVDELDLRVTTFGSDHSCTEGLAGGLPGAGSNGILVKEGDGLDAIAAGRVPIRPGDWRGEWIPLPSKCDLTLGRTDVFVAVPHGGGGFGDPLTRDAELVARDVNRGYVSIERARDSYGVVVTDRMQVDAAATEQQRREYRRRRLEGAGAPASSAQRDGACERCAAGEGIGGPASAPVRRTRAVGAANPWTALRWGGHSRRFTLVEEVCPACGELVDAYQALSRRDVGDDDGSIGERIASA